MGGPSFLTGDLRRGAVPEATTQRSSAREGISQAEARGSRVISSSRGNINKAQRCETARGVWEAGSSKVRVTCQQERLAAARLCSLRRAWSTEHRQHQHRPRACQECRIPRPSQTYGMEIFILIRIPGDADAPYRLGSFVWMDWMDVFGSKKLQSPVTR